MTGRQFGQIGRPSRVQNLAKRDRRPCPTRFLTTGLPGIALQTKISGPHELQNKLIPKTKPGQARTDRPIDPVPAVLHQVDNHRRHECWLHPVRLGQGGLQTQLHPLVIDVRHAAVGQYHSRDAKNRRGDDRHLAARPRQPARADGGDGAWAVCVTAPAAQRSAWLHHALRPRPVQAAAGNERVCQARRQAAGLRRQRPEGT